MRRWFWVAALTLALARPLPAPAQPGPVLERWPDRARITDTLRDLQRVTAPEGVDAQELATIGGVEQWLSIRGQNRENPVLLVIHGGPGTPMTPMAWTYQKPWEDYFTVVNWDQRGVGKNAATADLEKLAPTLSVDRLVDDAAEVAAYLRKRLGKDKIVVLGYSFGSLLGARLAMRHPELVSADVGVGQFVTADSESYLYERILPLRADARLGQGAWGPGHRRRADGAGPLPATGRRAADRSAGGGAEVRDEV